MDPLIGPHVTLRASEDECLGPKCWSGLRDHQLQRTIAVRSVAVTVFDGSDWVAFSDYRLG